MGFGKAFAAGKRYEDNHATLERGKRSRVVPVERGNTFDSERGFWKLTAVTKQQFGVAHSLVTKKRWWRRRASTGAALRCLLAHAKRIPALAKLGDAALVELAEAMRRTMCEAGDVVIRQGSPGDYFYVVESGRFVATNDTGWKLQAYGPGGYFGELALLRNAPRAATVTCSSADGGTLWALDRSTFRRHVMSVRHCLVVVGQERGSQRRRIAGVGLQCIWR